MNKKIEIFAQTILEGGLLERQQIDDLLIQSKNDFDDLLYLANKIRHKFFGDRIKVCSIITGSGRRLRSGLRILRPVGTIQYAYKKNNDPP